MIARSIQGQLPEAFFGKLTSTLTKARTQIESYCGDPEVQKYVYVVLNFNEILHEYVENYTAQLLEFCAGINLSSVEIVFDVKPRFYSATSESPALQLFLCTTGRAASTQAQTPVGSSAA